MVLAIVNGAVPVATLLSNILLITLPLAPKLPTLALPETLNVPEIFAPVPVTVTMFALPTADIVTLPFDEAIRTLLLPFANGPNKLPTKPVVVSTNTFDVPPTLNVMLPEATGTFILVVPFAYGPIKLPPVILPDTLNEVNVPTLVMFGCAAVVSVPVTNVADRAPVAALKDKFAFAPCAKFPDVAFANSG